MSIRTTSGRLSRARALGREAGGTLGRVAVAVGILAVGADIAVLLIGAIA